MQNSFNTKRVRDKEIKSWLISQSVPSTSTEAQRFYRGKIGQVEKASF